MFHPLWECNPLFLFFFFFSNTVCNKVRKIGLHEGKENNQYAMLFFYLRLFYLFRLESARSDLVDERRPYNGREGCGAGRIREEAAAICLRVQLTMCEEPVGRYESHKLSC